MQFRCGNCHGTVWVQLTAGMKNQAVVQCRTCSQEYDLGPTLQRVDVADLHQDAVVLAKSSEIDLQAAYSVLLRILSPEEAKDGCSPSLRSSDHGADTGPAATYDRAFDEAIEAGHLTPYQATQRGKRQAYAEKLVARHRLPLEQALAVADNRISLLQAMRARQPRARIIVEPERPGNYKVPLAIAVGAVLAVAAIFALTRSPHEAGNSEVRPGYARTELTTVEVNVNLQGEPTEVSGQDPASVLAAFCESVTSGGLLPVGLEASDDDWTGVYREDGSLYALTIRRDPLRDLWVVGNAVEPIEAERSRKEREPESLAAHPPSAARERAVVERNARGTIQRVSASDPAIVLRAYCQVAGGGCEPLELRAGVAAEAGLRFGVFRDFGEEMRRIAIRRDTHRRWIAGDGSGPIEVAAAGEQAPGAFVVPVSR